MALAQPITPRIDALTGLRFLAALAVYLHHHPKPEYLPNGLTNFFSAGYNGVTLFFVLSGFVLGINYFDVLVRPSWRAGLKYIFARLARVYPLYFLVLFYIWLNRGAPPSGNALIHFLALQSWSPDLPVAYGFNEPGWSIGVEFFLYACFPLLVLLFAPWRRNQKWLWGLAGGVTLALIALAVYFELSGRGILPIQNPDSAHRWLYRTPLTRLGDFTLGVIAALLFQNQDGARTRAERVWAILSYAALVGIIFLMALPAHLNSVLSWDASYAPLVFVLILGLARAPQTRLAHFLASRPLIILGEASFALYLIHSTLMNTFDIARFTDAEPWIAIPAWVLFGAVCILLSISLNHYVETPLRRTLNNWIERVLALTNTPAGRERVLLASITILAVVLGYIFFIGGRQDLFWDAKIYAQLGKQIATNGLFQFSDETRTYGYPLFLASIWRVSEFLPFAFQLLVFNAQLTIFLLACHLAFRVFRRIFDHRELALGLFALIALNPFLLIYTGVVLSDLLSAILIFVALLFAIDAPAAHSKTGFLNRTRKTLHDPATHAFLSFFAAGCAAMVRPASLTIVFAIGIVWLLRAWIFKESRIRLWLLIGIGLCLPFIPQVINNYRAYGQMQPLIMRTLYNEQLNWGMRYLKYASVVLPGYASGIAYVNPLWESSLTTPGEFLRQMPREFFLTQGLHLFALFDHDYAFPYITELLDVWYRVPLSIVNYLFLFGALYGIVIWLPRVVHPRLFGRLDLALAGSLASALFYLAGYVLVAVEPRFSLPVYLMLTPFFIYAVWRAQTGRAHWQVRVIELMALSIFLWGNLALYQWFQTGVPVLDIEANNPVMFERYKMNDLHIQWDDGIELVAYGMDQTRAYQGGDKLHLLFKWSCLGATAARYDAEITLIDSRNRVWAQSPRDVQARQSLCVNRLWMSSQVGDIVTLPLPIAMPAGEYRAIVRLYDRANDRYASTASALGAQSREHFPLVTLAIEKNKASFTASQLFLKNPFFVDLQEMRLLGYADVPSQVHAGDALDVGLYWRARGKPQGDYSITVQLRDAMGNVVVEQTARPAENTYPTTAWNEGEVLLDWHTLDLSPNILAGEYSLVTILRDAGRGKIIGEAQFTKILVAR